MLILLKFKTRMGFVITPYSDWPRWLQVAVALPNCVFVYFLLYKWWPKTKRQWRKFEITFACWMVYLLVMIYVFHMH